MVQSHLPRQCKESNLDSIGSVEDGELIQIKLNRIESPTGEGCKERTQMGTVGATAPCDCITCCGI